MYCPWCGTENPNEAAFCISCGKSTAPGAAAPVKPPDDPVSRVIPYKNPTALAAYYLGVFSVIPCLGALLGISALVLGIMGLVHANKHPEVHGKVHAWIGIIMGGICGIGWIVLAVVAIAAGSLGRF